MVDAVAAYSIDALAPINATPVQPLGSEENVSVVCVLHTRADDLGMPVLEAGCPAISVDMTMPYAVQGTPVQAQPPTTHTRAHARRRISACARAHVLLHAKTHTCSNARCTSPSTRPARRTGNTHDTTRKQTTAKLVTGHVHAHRARISRQIGRYTWTRPLPCSWAPTACARELTSKL